MQHQSLTLESKIQEAILIESHVVVGGVGFISNVLSPVVAKPVEMVPGLVLRNPSEQELRQIKSELHRYGRQGTFLDGSHLYEGEWHWGPERTIANYVALKEEDWRYNVLEYSDSGEVLNRARRAFAMVEPEIKVPLVVHNATLQTVMNQIWLIGDLAAILRHPHLYPDPPSPFGQDQLSAIRSAWDDLEQLPKSFEAIHRAIELLLDLQTLREDSSFRVLGLFAVLEILLTHNPSGKELGDSLTHQIATKVPLVSNRMPIKLPYSAHFEQAAEGTIWKALYAYRSALAHGTEPTFAKNQAVLKSPDIAMRFLHTAVRSIARHAVRETQLYADLKAV